MPAAVALTPSPSGLLADAFASATAASATLHALVPALSRPAPPPPADTAKVQQLASLLKSDLLKSGELGQIRAQLSARAFQLLSAQRADGPVAQQQAHDPVVLGLIAEYLAFYGLEHSLHTLLLETTTVRCATPSVITATAPTPSNVTSPPPARVPLCPVAAPLVQRLPPMTSSTADPTLLSTDSPRTDSPGDVSEFSTSLSTRAPAAVSRATDAPTASASACSAPPSRSSAPARSAASPSLAVPAPVSRSASSVSSLIADGCDTSIGSASASMSFSRMRGDTTDDADFSLDTSDYSLSTASSVSSLGGAGGRRHGSAAQPRRSRRFKGLKLPDIDAYLLHKDVVLDL
ncbi:hypothetical protein GGF31_006786 [Allomyces arbusculus]|nr:hypothetical protein GGF31_006786 [Allomyces arbusculus]